MKEYIVLTIDDSDLIFDYRTLNDEEAMFINKNNVFKGSLFYTLKYYKKHINSICKIIKKDNKTYNNLMVLKLITFKYAAKLIDELEINSLNLCFSSTVSIEDYNLFLTLKSLKKIYCFYMAENIKKEFDKAGIEVYTTCRSKVSEKFMSWQEVDETDKLYYKKIINIKEEYPTLINDLKTFLKINYNLKAIHIYVYSKELISTIVDLVKNDESRNVIVFLHQGYDKGDFIVNNFKWLKDLSDKCKEDYTCEFRIVYSNSFLGKNLFKQLTFNNLKLISILCVYVSMVIIVIIKSYEYVEKISVDEFNIGIINDTLASRDSDNTNTEEEPKENTNNDLIDDADVVLDKEPTKEEIKNKYTFEKSFKALKKINNETVGYLIVKNTNISYPVVKHSDNNYYLKRDFYKKKSGMGWVFMDYRNNPKDFNDNTIIYAHSMLNGTMFGTLKKVLNSTWRSNEDNLIINYDTENGSYKFKIFSIYKVDYTTDYLQNSFNSETEMNDFIKMIRDRSIFKTKDSVKYGDKILTLSTCTGNNNRRLVVHAVLLKEGEK